MKRNFNAYYKPKESDIKIGDAVLYIKAKETTPEHLAITQTNSWLHRKTDQSLRSEEQTDPCLSEM